MYDIIIVGAGPAGLTAALYALRANKKVLIFEANTYGGQIINANKMENYPGIKSISGFDYATLLYNQVMDLGAEIKYETVLRIDENKNVITNNDTYNSKTIILATGAKNRKLGIKNENEYLGKGLSYCATCDGNFYKDKIVAVVGGGNTAITDAIYLSDIASKVYLIHRKDSFRADDKYIIELKEKNNIEFILNTNITDIYGDNILEGIKLDNGLDINVNGLFIAVGQEPKNEIFSELIDIDEKGYIISNDGVHTNVNGIYVAGDARVKNLRQVITAVSDGAIAATTAILEMKKVD
ncbi:MAG: thioredoxin-disulfide reductase [Firmicutes bacterium]|nr:thioredoxin-disulfide reductase [Bacillota bacterium]